MNLQEFLKRAIEQEEQDVQQSRFRYLHIHERALRKAQRYGRLVAEELDGVECMGYLLTDRDGDFPLVTEVILATGQEAERDFVEISGVSVIRAGEEARTRGKRVVGWWHSHPRFRPYHSGEDDENLERVLREIAGSNYFAIESKGALLEGEIGVEFQDDAVILKGDAAHLKLTLAPDSDVRDALAERLRVTRVELKATEYISYAYSLVVTAESDETHAEILVKRWGSHPSLEETAQHEIKLNILYQDQEEMLEEIRAKVKPVRRWSRWWERQRG